MSTHIKIYVVGSHQNRLSEAILMSTNNVCFYGDVGTHQNCLTEAILMFIWRRF